MDGRIFIYNNRDTGIETLEQRETGSKGKQQDSGYKGQIITCTMERNHYSFRLTVGKLKCHILTNFDVFWEKHFYSLSTSDIDSEDMIT